MNGGEKSSDEREECEFSSLSSSSDSDPEVTETLRSHALQELNQLLAHPAVPEDFKQIFLKSSLFQ